MNIFDQLSKPLREILETERNEIAVMSDRISQYFQKKYEESGSLQHKDLKPLIDFYNKEVRRSKPKAKKSAYDLLSGRASQ